MADDVDEFDRKWTHTHTDGLPCDNRAVVISRRANHPPRNRRHFRSCEQEKNPWKKLLARRSMTFCTQCRQ